MQRDVGGYAVALAASMKHIYCGEPGETMFTTSDIGWVVGHSYIIYAPLIAGMTTIMYEGVPIRPDAGVWWKIVQDHKVAVMFSAPTAIRVLKKQDPAFLKKYDLSSLKHLFLAGEPLDEPTHVWISEALGRPVIDHYWQTETGWPLLSAHPGVEKTHAQDGLAELSRCTATTCSCCTKAPAKQVADGEKGVVTIKPPLPPGCMSTVWGDDERFVQTYFKDFKNSLLDLRLGHPRQGRLLLHPRAHRRRDQRRRPPPRHARDRGGGQHASEHRRVRGGRRRRSDQGPDAAGLCGAEGRLEEPLPQDEVMQTVDKQLGAIARPKAVHFVSLLPKTRSGKTLRRSIQALAEGRDPGDLTTIEDPNALEQIKQALR